MPALVRVPPFPGSPVRALPTSALGATAILRAIVLLASAAFIAAFALAAAFRLTFPFALHPGEPASLGQVDRVLRGLPIYVEPTLQHIPLVYGPLYFYASAALATVVGDNFAALRLTSLVASIVSMALIWRLVRRETGSAAAGLLSVGLFAASYPFGDTALDLGRVDALFTCLVLAALYLGRRPTFDARHTTLAIAGCGVCVALAALTKLPLGAAPIALALLLYLAYAHRRYVPIYLLAGAAVLLAGVLLLRLQSGPWATWYLWDLPRLHTLHPDMIARFWWTDLLPRYTIALALGPIFLIARWVRDDRATVVLYALTAGSLFALGWLSRSNAGGAPNVLWPTFAIVAILFGLGIHTTLGLLASAQVWTNAFRAYVLVLCAVQFGLLAYNTRLTVPYRSDQWADERLAARLAALPGPIFAPDLESWLRGSGHDEQPMMGSLDEVRGAFGGSGTAEGQAIMDDLKAALQERRFRYVVLGEDDCCIVGMVRDAGYVDAGPLFPPGDVFFEWKTRHTPEEHLYAAPGEH